jgi:hypothetical protein
MMVKRTFFRCLRYLFHMEYYVFVQDDSGMEKLVASSPSLEIARKTAQRMSNVGCVRGRNIVSALICRQEGDGAAEDLEKYYKGEVLAENLLYKDS